MTQRVQVDAGTGQWAYWRTPEQKSVIADDICQPEAVHFAGMLGQYVAKTPCEAELHTDGFTPVRPKSIWAREVESEAHNDGSD